MVTSDSGRRPSLPAFLQVRLVGERRQPAAADPRASTLGAYLRVLREALPRAFLLENVEGLAYRGKSEGLQLLLDEVASINRDRGTAYEPVVLRSRRATMACLRCAVGCWSSASGMARDSTCRRAPTARASAWSLIAPPGTPSAICRPATRTCACGANGRTCCRAFPEGQNYLWHTDRGGGEPLFGWRRRYWSFLLKLAKDRPSWTIQAQPGPATGPFHWESRLLTIRELCRLQTFPDDVTIVGNRQSAVRQIGNAVPSLLAEVIGRALLEQAFGIKPKTSAPTLLPPRRGEPTAARARGPGAARLPGAHRQARGTSRHRPRLWRRASETGRLSSGCCTAQLRAAAPRSG